MVTATLRLHVPIATASATHGWMSQMNTDVYGAIGAHPVPYAGISAVRALPTPSTFLSWTLILESLPRIQTPQVWVQGPLPMTQVLLRIYWSLIADPTLHKARPRVQVPPPEDEGAPPGDAVAPLYPILAPSSTDIGPYWANVNEADDRPR